MKEELKTPGSTFKYEQIITLKTLLYCFGLFTIYSLLLNTIGHF